VGENSSPIDEHASALPRWAVNVLNAPLIPVPAYFDVPLSPVAAISAAPLRPVVPSPIIAAGSISGGPLSPDSWRQGMRLEAVANLAHELRTPVQVLLGYVDVLREDYSEEFSSEPRALLDRMNANVHDLAQTIDNLMHFVLSEVNAETITDEDVTPGSLIAEITPVLEAANQHKHLELKFDFTGTPELFRVARRPLKSILLNLAVNAIKFTDTGSVTVALRSLRDRLLGSAIEIEVSDTGPGLDPAMLSRATEPFAQLSNGSARRYRGLGLGLAVVQRGVKALGGKLELRSHEGTGSTFLVTIPVQMQENTARIARVATNRRRKPSIVSTVPATNPRKPSGLR
jgi:signal transduction histidine kinase